MVLMMWGSLYYNEIACSFQISILIQESVDCCAGECSLRRSKAMQRSSRSKRLLRGFGCRTFHEGDRVGLTSLVEEYPSWLD